MTVRSSLRNTLPGLGLACLMATSLLLASVTEVRAQTVCVLGICAVCTKPQPGTICCESPLGYTCEPDPNYRGDEDNEGSAEASPPTAPAPEFDAQTQFQIQPLSCPRGFATVGQTFYGGTKCAPLAAAPPPAVQPSARVSKPPTRVSKPPAQVTKPPAQVSKPVVPPQTQPSETAPAPPPPYFSDEDIAVAEWAGILAARREREVSPVLPMFTTGAILIVTGGAIAAGGGVIAAGVGGVAVGAVALYRYWPVMTGPTWTW